MSKVQMPQPLSDVRKPKLLDQVRAVIRRKHYSFRTEEDEALIGRVSLQERLSLSAALVAAVEAAVRPVSE